MVPKLNFPELYSLSKKKQLTFAEVKSATNLHSFFHLALSVQAFSQLGQLQSILQRTQVCDLFDTWAYSWGSANFFSRKAYRQLSGHCNIHPAFKWLWKTSCQNKHCFFCWLLMKDRLSTRGLLRRRNMEMEDYNCVLCDGQVEETVEYLFISCTFAQDCWRAINLNVDPSADPFSNLERLRSQLNRPFFMEIIILLSWAIWMARNNMIFRQINATTQRCKSLFLVEMDALLLRAKKIYSPRLQEWIIGFT